MGRLRLTRPVLLVSGLVLAGQLLAVPASGDAVSSVARLAASGTASSVPQEGYYVRGHGRAFVVHRSAEFLRTSFDVDRQGDDHVLASYGRGREVATFYSRRNGSSRWITSPVGSVKTSEPEQNDDLDSTRVLTGISTDGREQFAVVTTCEGVYATEGPARAARLPKFHEARRQPPNACDFDADDDTGTVPRYGLRNAVALPHHRYAVLMDVASSDDTSTVRIFIGHHSGALTAISPALPRLGSDAILVRDSATGTLFVFADNAGRDQANLVETSKRPGRQWSAVTTIAAGSRTVDGGFNVYDIESAAADRGRVKVALQHLHSVDKDCSGCVSDGYMVSRAHGRWAGPRRVPGMQPQHDGGMLLISNPTTHHFHLAYTRRSPAYTHSTKARSGLIRQLFLHGRWQAPKYVVHSTSASVQGVAIDPAQKLAVLYMR